MSRLIPSDLHLHPSSLIPLAGDRVQPIEIGRRFAFPDTMRGIAACLIAWHHMSCYSPSSDTADLFAPALMYGIYNYALFLVYVFLVLGGFALAMAFPEPPRSLGSAACSFFARYLRLAIPYLFMLACLLATSFLLSDLLQPPLIDSFRWEQLVAHLFFLQDILGYGNFSAGTWYLCIDIQFAALFLLLQILAYAILKSQGMQDSVFVVSAAILIPLGLTSAWYWSRIEALEPYVLYFMGPLVMGTLIAWASKGKIPKIVVILYMLSMASSLFIEFRPRIVVGVVSGILLWLGVSYWSQLKIPAPLRWLGKVSYSLFLIHYLVNGILLSWIHPWAKDRPAVAFLGMVIAFLFSLLSAGAMHSWIEAPSNRWIKGHFRTR